jgi:hypothetical protein
LWVNRWGRCHTKESLRWKLLFPALKFLFEAHPINEHDSFNIHVSFGPGLEVPCSKGHRCCHEQVQGVWFGFYGGTTRSMAVGWLPIQRKQILYGQVPFRSSTFPSKIVGWG